MSGSWGRTVAVVAVMAAAAGGCGTSKTAPPSPAQEAFLSQVHNAATDINRYRSDTQLLRLGTAACDGFATGETFQALADRLAGDVGSLPTAELGSVIVAAADNLCPEEEGKVS